MIRNTSRQNKSESAAVSSDRAVMAVTAECDMMPGIVMSALICYDPPGQPLSLSSLCLFAFLLLTEAWLPAGENAQGSHFYYAKPIIVGRVKNRPEKIDTRYEV